MRKSCYNKSQKGGNKIGKDLQQIFRSILKEELVPIHKRLDEIDKKFVAIDQKFIAIDKRFDAIDKRFDEMEKRISAIEADVKQLKQDNQTMVRTIMELKASQEQSQKNIVDTIGKFTVEIIKYIDHKTEVLNKRVFKTETEIERLLNR